MHDIESYQMMMMMASQQLRQKEIRFYPDQNLPIQSDLQVHSLVFPMDQQLQVV